MKTLIVICSCMAGIIQAANAALPVEWPVASGGNGHFYEAVAVPSGISWTGARDAAVSDGGYLAAITSQAENEFVFAQVDEAKYWHQLPADPNNHGPWLGGFRNVVSGPFFWVTGETFSYTAWFAGTGEPTGGWWLGQPEDRLQYSSARNTRAPTWNDLINDLPAEYAVYGYVIEYDENPSPIHYVDVSNATPSAPYTNWVTAATNIQDAVDVASSNDTVLVNDGVYNSGTTIVSNMPNRVAITNAITVESVNGPDVTIVDGGGSNRCFNLGDFACTISGFTITNGYVFGSGAGVYCDGTNPVITNCLIIGNSAMGMLSIGGGVYQGTTRNCSVIANLANHGGGINRGIVHNSSIAGNIARYNGGGVSLGTAYHCTISGNTASIGGGMQGSTAYNSIFRDNLAFIRDWNLANTTAANSCSPDLEHGIDGNITNAPILVSASHVAVNSPCRNAGSNVYATGTDVDGEAWLNPPSMGCDEYHGSVTGLLDVTIDAADKVAAGYPLRIGASIKGAVTMHTWDFGNGTLATNMLYPVHTWNTPGVYKLILTAFNDTYPGGVSSTQIVHVAHSESTAVYVSPGGADSNTGTNWATAKATIQAGVDAQLYEGGLVWVSNGVYALTSEINVDKGIAIRSVNDPESTIIDGQGITRCFNLGYSASTLAGLTITNGYASGEHNGGGGVYCVGGYATITNCMVIGNTADNEGGGMHSGTVIDSLLLNNAAKSPQWGGGGMVWGLAYNCTVTGNTAVAQGGGLRCSIADSCIISDNTADKGGGMFIPGGPWIGGVIGYANNCTIVSNMANDSGGGIFRGEAYNCIFSDNYATSAGSDFYNILAITHSCSIQLIHGVDGNITNAPLFIGAGNYRLAPNSPCINAGSNGCVTVSTDLDGNPRIIGGTVDMGAYEYYLGYVIDCYPVDSGFSVEWIPDESWNAVVQYSTNLIEMPFTDLSAALPYPQNIYTDTVHAAENPCFYQVEVRLK